MQLADRLAATLLAVTWITPVAQGATVLRDFTLIASTDKHKVQPLARLYTAGQGLVFKGCHGGVAGLNRPVADVAEARRAADQQVAKGVDFIKLWVDDEFGDLP